MNRSSYILLGVLALAAAVWYWSRRPNHRAGDQASDFSAQLADGRTVRLADLRGRYVLLQFWGSWCGPCRAENPHLVSLYRKYHDRGFDIFSVGIERDARAWQRAIQRDSLVWPYHTSDLKNFDNAIARQYNVKEIPATFLINPDGVVMGVGLSHDMLDRMLAEALP